ncbi:ras-related protein Rab-8A [Caerostris extrusa]|uniref:Ras-related protein Rab-8A n=1 Tax=Caerostris extrusa TaxID=172846 RepID=A0AAV4RZX7_CAEEX|nr:ras-related protein Rab-8A [Caerostris extrusa]
MYDVTNMDSFNHLSYWFRNVEENASPDVVKVLVGNKCDSTNLRVVDQDQGRKVAESCDVPFFECSCKEDVNIDEIFLTVARMIREQRERRKSILNSSKNSPTHYFFKDAGTPTSLKILELNSSKNGRTSNSYEQVRPPTLKVLDPQLP